MISMYDNEQKSVFTLFDEGYNNDAVASFLRMDEKAIRNYRRKWYKDNPANVGKHPTKGVRDITDAYWKPPHYRRLRKVWASSISYYWTY